MATDGSCVYCVEATDDADAIFIQTDPFQRGEDVSMRYQIDSIGEIQPGNRALSPRTSNITYGKIGFFQSSDVCDVVAAVGPIYLQVI